MKQKKVALAKGDSLIKTLKKVIPDAQYAYFDNYTEVLKAVALGKADAAITELPVAAYLIRTLSITNLKITAEAGVVGGRDQRYRLAVRKDWPILVSILEKAMDTLSPEELNRLDDKWASLPGFEGKKQIQLTDKELSWLVEHPVIRLGIHKDWEPAVIIEEDGKLSGFLVDFFDILNRKLRTNIVIETGAWSDIVQRARNQEIDGLAACAPVLAKANRFLSTRSHFITYVTAFVQADDPNKIKSFKDLEGRTVSLVKGAKIFKVPLKPFQDKIKVIETRSSLEAIKLVIEGKADAAVGMNIDNYLITRHMLHGIKMGCMDIDHPILAVTAIRNDWPELVGILNKGMDSIGQAKINEISAKWLNVRKPTHTTQLTEKEKAWLEAHPKIQVGIMDAWPPMDFVDEMGTPRGIGVDYINVLNKHLGGRLIIVPGPWKEIYEKVKEKKLDALTGITPKEFRKPFFNFTKPYIKIPHSIVARKDGPYYQNEEDLSGKTIALERGFFLVKTLKENQPETTIKEYDSTSKALVAVARSKADAYIGNQAVASYIIEKELLNSLQIQGRSQGAYSVNAIGVRKDWPILAKILDRVLDSVTEEEKKAIHSKWMPAGASPTVSSHGQGRILTILGLVVGILIVFTAVIWLLMRLIGDRLPSGFQAAGSRIAGLIIASAFVAAIVAYTWFGIRSMDRQIRADMIGPLKTVLSTTQETLRIWLEDEKEHIDEYARDPRLIEIVRRQLEVTRTRKALLTSSSLKDLRAYFLKQLHHKQKGFFIISKDLINIASMRDKNIGWHNLIAEQRPELLQKAFAGETVFVPPIHSDVPLIDQGSGQMQVAPPTMFVAAPIRDGGGRVIAVMTLRSNLGQDFTRLLNLGRIGRSGETYAFNRTARLLSKSRFEDDLVQIGLLPKGKQSILSVRISDPGGNLLEGHQPSTPPDKQPLTYMAASAVSGLAGINEDGYRDYRGVRVPSQK